MRILLFVTIWMEIFLGVPGILHSWFSSREYPIVLLSVVISFVGGALLAAWITGFFDDDLPSQLHTDRPENAAKRDVRR